MVRRSTWIVLGIFILLVGFAILFQRYQVNKAADTATATPTTPPVLLYNLDGAQADSIKIADKTGKVVDLYHDPTTTKWAIEGLPVDLADTSQIEAVSTQLLGLQVKETMAETLSLAAIGLDTPAYTITLTSSAGSQFVTYVGMQTAIGTGYYVRDGNGQVMIVDKASLDNILNVLNTPPLLPTATSDVTPIATLSPILPTGLETPTP